MGFTEYHFLTHDKLSLYYRSYGSGGNVVVCLPGLSRNSSDFHELASYLVPGFRVLCLDFRGRGQSARDPKWRNYHPGSYARDVWAMLDHEGVDKCILVGTSLGGLVAMIMASQKPERLKAIVLNDIGPEADPVGYARILASVSQSREVESWQQAAERCKQVYGPAFPGVPDGYWDGFAHKTYRQGEDGKPEFAADTNIYLAFAKSARIRSILTRLRKLRLLYSVAGVPIEPWDAFKAVSMPCLVIRGEISDILSEVIIDRMCLVKPDLKRVTIAGRGHAPMLDEPDSQEAIDKFLSQFISPGVDQE